MATPRMCDALCSVSEMKHAFGKLFRRHALDAVVAEGQALEIGDMEQGPQAAPVADCIIVQCERLRIRHAVLSNAELHPAQLDKTANNDAQPEFQSPQPSTEHTDDTTLCLGE